MLATPARYYHPRLLALTVPHIAGGRTAREPSVLAEQAAARLHRPPDPLGYVYQLYAVAGWSSLPWLHRVPHPALIVAGDKDPSVPLRNARVLAARLPNARLHIVKGGGHLFLIDEPRERRRPDLRFPRPQLIHARKHLAGRAELLLERRGGKAPRHAAGPRRPRDREGHGLDHLTVEHARDDVLGVQLAVCDHSRDGVRGRRASSLR